MTESPSLPETCSIAFKEWAGVCDALGSGRQSLILRKGGISEGPAGFQPDHRVFWLYPTFVHEAEQGLRSKVRPGLVETPGEVVIDALVVVEWVARIEHVAQLAGLVDYHDWSEASLLTRFHYRKPGLWAFGVRTFPRPEPWRLPITEAHLGCKTWVPLEVPGATAGVVAVLDDETSSRRLERIRSAISG